MKRLMAALMGMVILAQGASANPPLRDVVEVEKALLIIGQADGIRRNCPTITPRRVKVVSFVLRLENRARKMGYTKEQITAYTKSDADKKRLRAKAAALLEAKGVDTSDPQSYCAVGMTEIQNSSPVGSLLRAK